MVDRLDVQLGKAPALPVVERRVREVVGHERVIDLQIKTGVDDRLVLMAQRVGDGEEELLVRLVVLVRAGAAWRHRRHERHLGARRRNSGLEVVDVAAQRLRTLVACRAGADRRHDGSDRAAGHGAREVLLVVLGERLALGVEESHLLAWPRLEAGEALAYISKEAGLRLLAIRDDVYAAFDLLPHALGDGALHATRVALAIVRLAGEPGLHQVEEIVRPRQAADVRYLYAGHFFFCISFQGSLTAVATVSSSTLASWPFTLRTSRRYSFC